MEYQLYSFRLRYRKNCLPIQPSKECGLTGGNPFQLTLQGLGINACESPMGLTSVQDSTKESHKCGP